MKNAAKKWYNYMFMVIGAAIIFVAGYLPYALGDKESWPLKYVCYFMIFGGIVFIGVGFIIQDVYRGIIRHKINDWDNKLDEKYLNKAWSIFFPLLTSGFLSFLIGLITYLFIK